MKRDQIREDLAGSVGYVVDHRNKIIVAAVLAVVIGAGLAFYVGHRQTERVAARKALHDAIELFHGQVTTEARVGVTTFTTTIERRTRTTEALEAVQRQYAGTPEADTAQYYLALLDIEDGKYQEAQPKLESAIQSGDPEAANLARLALANVYEQLEKPDEARQQYQYLVDHPTIMVPKGRAQLALARHLMAREPEQARQILSELMAQPGALGGAATTALREMYGT